LCLLAKSRSSLFVFVAYFYLSLADASLTGNRSRGVGGKSGRKYKRRKERNRARRNGERNTRKVKRNDEEENLQRIRIHSNRGCVESGKIERGQRRTGETRNRKDSKKDVARKEDKR
jgi:hypothetical protein